MRTEKESAKANYRVKIIRFVLLAVFLAIGYNLAVSQYGFLNMMELKEQIDELQAEELRYNVQLVDLEIKRSRLRSDSLYIEKLARKHYQLSRPGETVIEF